MHLGGFALAEFGGMLVLVDFVLYSYSSGVGDNSCAVAYTFMEQKSMKEGMNE